MVASTDTWRSSADCLRPGRHIVPFFTPANVQSGRIPELRRRELDTQSSLQHGRGILHRISQTSRASQEHAACDRVLLYDGRVRDVFATTLASRHLVQSRMRYVPNADLDELGVLHHGRSDWQGSSESSLLVLPEVGTVSRTVLVLSMVGRH